MDAASFIMDNNDYNTCVEVHRIYNRSLQTLPATLVSSSLSIIGSILIITSFILWSEVRQSNARKLIFFLAISDFFTGVGFIFGGLVRNFHNFALNFTHGYNYADICKGQAAVTVYFQCVSLFITASIAIYFFVVLIFNSSQRVAKGITICSVVVSYVIPIFVGAFVLAVNGYGVGDSRSSVGWCFISNTMVKYASNQTEFHTKLLEYFGLELLSLKMWEFLTFFVIVFCYLAILFFNRCRCLKIDIEERQRLITPASEKYSTNGGRISALKKGKLFKSLSKADLKFILIPIILILFRMWGNIRFFISMKDSYHIYTEEEFSANFCINQECFNALYNEILLVLHAFGDPGQGFGNAILFVFLSKPIVMKMFVNPVVKVFGWFCTYPKQKRTSSNVLDKSSIEARPYIIITYSKDKDTTTTNKIITTDMN